MAYHEKLCITAMRMHVELQLALVNCFFFKYDFRFVNVCMCAAAEK